MQSGKGACWEVYGSEEKQQFMRQKYYGRKCCVIFVWSGYGQQD